MNKEPTGPSLKWLIRARIKRAEEQRQSYTILLEMVESEDFDEKLRDMLTKLLLALP